MSTIASPEVSLVDATNATDMVHFVCDCAPLHGLCGAPLRGIDVDDDVECVVCCEMVTCHRCKVDS